MLNKSHAQEFLICHSPVFRYFDRPVEFCRRYNLSVIHVIKDAMKVTTCMVVIKVRTGILLHNDLVTIEKLAVSITGPSWQTPYRNFKRICKTDVA